MDKNELNEILINKQVKEKLDIVLKYIPEVSYMIGFGQNHPHHHLDVLGHTLLALDNLETNDLETNMALLLHDIGKPLCYQDAEVRHFHGHPDKSEEMADKILHRLGYDEEFITNVCYLVKKHDEIIDPDNLDNTDEMINKRLEIQYADTKAHNKDKIEPRIRKLNEVKERIEESRKHR